MNPPNPIPKIPEATLLTLPELKRQYIHYKGMELEAKGLGLYILSEITNLFSADRKSALEASGKESGSMSFEEAGIKMKFEIKKKVKWNSDLLMSIGAKLPKAIAEKIFKIEISVPEKMFDGLTDAGLITELKTARTVEYGTPTVTFNLD